MDVMSDGVHLNLRSSQQIVHTHLKARNRKEEIEKTRAMFHVAIDGFTGDQ